MTLPYIIEKTMKLFPNSFINYKMELILIPRHNVYVCLNDVETETDFLVKLVEWFSRECCSAIRYSKEWRLKYYWECNTNNFNTICNTNFSIDDMEYIYTYLGNGIRHELAKDFVTSGFDLKVIENYLCRMPQYS